MNDQDALIKEFLVESLENLDQLDRDLVALERNSRDRERLGNVFRIVHTIKGTCGFFGFAKLEAVTHTGESLLNHLRDGRLLLDAEITSALLALVDALRQMLASIESTGHEGAGDYTALIEGLDRLQGEGLQKKVDCILQAVNAAAQGDLTQDVRVEGEAAIGQVGSGLKSFPNDMRGLSVLIAQNADQAPGPKHRERGGPGG
jgi:chemotaxis protein histidine kinase CheA